MHINPEDYISHFSAAQLNKRVAQLYWRHRSGLTPEDYKTGVLALGRAEQVIQQFEYSGNDQTDFLSICDQLKRLLQHYNDRSGQYTSGKGEIGSFLIDLASDGESYFLQLPDPSSE